MATGGSSRRGPCVSATVDAGLCFNGLELGDQRGVLVVGGSRCLMLGTCQGKMGFPLYYIIPSCVRD